MISDEFQIESLMNLCDAALYDAKRSGRNRVVTVSDDKSNTDDDLNFGPDLQAATPK